MTSGLAPLIPLAMPHFRKGEIDVALIKHQAMAVAVGLAVRQRGGGCCACARDMTDVTKGGVKDEPLADGSPPKFG